VAALPIDAEQQAVVLQQVLLQRVVLQPAHEREAVQRVAGLQEAAQAQQPAQQRVLGDVAEAVQVVAAQPARAATLAARRKTTGVVCAVRSDATHKVALLRATPQAALREALLAALPREALVTTVVACAALLAVARKVALLLLEAQLPQAPQARAGLAKLRASVVAAQSARAATLLARRKTTDAACVVSSDATHRAALPRVAPQAAL